MDNRLICEISTIIQREYKMGQVVNIYEAKDLIEGIVKERVDNKVINIYLLEKGFNVCEEKHTEKKIECDKTKENALSKHNQEVDLLSIDALDLFNMDIDFSSYYDEIKIEKNSDEDEGIHKEVINKSNKTIRNYSFTDNKILLQEYKIYGNDELLEKIVESNLKLVRKYASFYAKFLSGAALSEDDLFQVGQLALLKAVEKFDTTLNFTFSTYATWWIKQAITREICDKDSMIRLPVHMHELLMKLRKNENKYIVDEHCSEKVCNELGITEEKYIKLKQIQSKFVDKMVPLDATIGEGKDTIYGELLEDKEQECVEDYAIYIELQDEFKNILGTLTPKEEKVIRLRFGLDDNRQRTLEEVGKEFNLTRERIRQIEAKALRKLRHPSRSRRFRCYLYD
ncbi:sigma-70 family RNA polymerase sigma factor [Clostridium tagluense]|uniref:sigma-70 family RNA polymerase sigma factor n=1 Tax=Clostridium tagluense TaxID=360422 RepID=UPI001CF49345|nr:sigma-70 family RNA polymerase sigma factor [Clostridium tagluense]MCB2313458.1 sigma-70 family RNA polymerase sigma factor [Clostridium tagluense]MCB2318275.1 sigma-70 family RNA polymerase sigma factor [Clostridium tagluense]MCB2323077.1 sigma-70 family RNA polymerase sigma factor [Clostridium tagluense]MCB2328059.1 sigma-70 family RNA polymerase sigma factor [Clostridium tagluense]MCB2332785.1 sigma-70 family RNA polymerase sigma factor [Clostridium tagluense]